VPSLKVAVNVADEKVPASKSTNMFALLGVTPRTNGALPPPPQPPIANALIRMNIIHFRTVNPEVQLSSAIVSPGAGLFFNGWLGSVLRRDLVDFDQSSLSHLREMA
jgi:hypothetical protein